jgi:hypothetical protein
MADLDNKQKVGLAVLLGAGLIFAASQSKGGRRFGSFVKRKGASARGYVRGRWARKFPRRRR